MIRMKTAIPLLSVSPMSAYRGIRLLTRHAIRLMTVDLVSIVMKLSSFA